MNRPQAYETLAAETRAGLPAVVREWTAPLRETIERLARAALDPTIDDTTFLHQLQDAARDIARLDLPAQHLADHMERAMGAAAVNGIAARLETVTTSTRPQVTR